MYDYEYWLATVKETCWDIWFLAYLDPCMYVGSVCVWKEGREPSEHWHLYRDSVQWQTSHVFQHTQDQRVLHCNTIDWKKIHCFCMQPAVKDVIWYYCKFDIGYTDDVKTLNNTSHTTYGILLILHMFGAVFALMTH